MSLTTTIENLMENYVTPFLTGAAYHDTLPSISRISEERYFESSEYNNELNQPNTPYHLGHAAGAVVTALLVSIGFQRLVEENDAALFLTTGITFLTTNIFSTIYELYLRKKS